jgi:hypothetical protein
MKKKSIDENRWSFPTFSGAGSIGWKVSDFFRNKKLSPVVNPGPFHDLTHRRGRNALSFCVCGLGFRFFSLGFRFGLGGFFRRRPLGFSGIIRNVPAASFQVEGAL